MDHRRHIDLVFNHRLLFALDDNTLWNMSGV